MASVHLEAIQRLQIYMREIRRGRFPDQQQLARLVERTPRTVARDFFALRFYLHAPIEYDPQERGFYLTEPNWKIEI